MYAIHLPTLGHIRLYLKSLFVSGGEYHITGRDEEGRSIMFNADKASFPDDYFDDYGWMHMVSYVVGGVKHQCDKYVSLG